MSKRPHFLVPRHLCETSFLSGVGVGISLPRPYTLVYCTIKFLLAHANLALHLSAPVKKASLSPKKVCCRRPKFKVEPSKSCHYWNSLCSVESSNQSSRQSQSTQSSRRSRVAAVRASILQFFNSSNPEFIRQMSYVQPPALREFPPEGGLAEEVHSRHPQAAH
eukprot:COSAG02_NODE_2861_length_7881_cov_10.967618_9_plen_164_part_00